MSKPTSIFFFVTALAVWLCALSIKALPGQDGLFQFGLIGDMPYTPIQEREYTRVLEAMNATDLAFVIHVGDTQPNPAAGTQRCTDDSYRVTLNSFQSVRHPLILTPGDNDWTDCHRVREFEVDPLERLAKIRALFYPDGRSLGQRALSVESQANDGFHSKFRENQRWAIGDVMFVTLHIVGSNDNFGRNPEMDAEHMERKAANLAWLRAAFARAKAENSKGLVLMAHANPGFENYWPHIAKSRYFSPFVAGGVLPFHSTAFGDYVAALRNELENWNRPVAFLHGDTHLFRIDKPLYSEKTDRLFESFTRVETFGDADMHWGGATLDPSDPQLLRFEAQIIPENVVNRRVK